MRETLGFSVLQLWLFFRSVFRFLCKKTSIFRFWCSLRFADFSFFSIWFSVFVENTSGFSVLFSDLVFRCSYFVLVGFRFLFDLSGNWFRIAAKRQSHWHEFLRAIGAIYKAFSVHNKGASYEKKTAEEAIGLVHHCKTVLEEHAYQIRAESNITGALNGPQGHVSATVNSVQLMEWGLGRTSRHSRRVWLPSAWSFKLYDIRRWKLPQHCLFQEREHV